MYLLDIPAPTTFHVADVSEETRLDSFSRLEDVQMLSAAFGEDVQDPAIAMDASLD